jgi:hypothetical protein
MRASPSPPALDLALQALGWILSDEDHAERLIALTGITPDALRDRLAGDEADRQQVLCAVLDFICAHEPDLIACAAAIGIEPPVLVAAAHQLSGPPTQCEDDTSDWRDTDWGA